MAQSCRGPSTLIHFWYHESPQPLSAKRQFHVSVDYDDPPFDQSGMLRLETDPDGKLIRFEAVPPQVEKAGPTCRAIRLEQALPGRRARSHISDHRTYLDSARQPGHCAAWTGTDLARELNCASKAAALAAARVLRIIGPWTVAGRMTRHPARLP